MADLLITQIETNKLTIRFKPNSRVKTKSLSKITILSSYPLEEAKVSSSATLNIKDPIQATTFELEASSSGRLLVNQIKANKIDLDVSSSGKIEVSLITNKLEIEASSSGKAIISGNAEDVSIDMSSSSNINLNDTQIKNLEIDGSTSAKAYINTVVNLRSDLSTSAKVFYNKTPTNIIKNKTSTSGKLLQN